MTEVMQWTSVPEEKLFSAGAKYISDKKYTIYMPFDIGPETPPCSVLDPREILIASPKTLADAKQAAQYHYEARLRHEDNPVEPVVKSVKPQLYSIWQHRNGNLYRVILFTNTEGGKPDRYPETVSYFNIDNGKGYSRRLDDWRRSMTWVRDDVFVNIPVDQQNKILKQQAALLTAQAKIMAAALERISARNGIPMPGSYAAEVAREALENAQIKSAAPKDPEGPVPLKKDVCRVCKSPDPTWYLRCQYAGCPDGR